jgi:hypothetical protein
MDTFQEIIKAYYEIEHMIYQGFFKKIEIMKDLEGPSKKQKHV